MTKHWNSWDIVCKEKLQKVVQWGKQVNFSRSQFSVVRCKVVLRINKWTGALIQNSKHCPLSLFTATEFDPCMMKPCQNGGICISRGVRQSPYYSCVCDAKWTGQDCQTKGTSMNSGVGSKLKREVGGGARLIKEILNKQKKKGDYGYVKLCTKKVRGGGGG